MKQALKLILFTLLVTGFYTWVGHRVPQKEVHPPAELVIRENMTADEMVEMGKALAEGKGTCFACHTLGSATRGRFPDLTGIGLRASTRKPGMTDIEYLSESLYEPSTYIVSGFNPGMPVINKSPIGLSDSEILCVIAFLQSLGGEVSVNLKTVLKYQRSSSPRKEP